MTKEHITRLEVSNFKKFDRLVVENIGQVNLITGDNNVGKTSLLEVLLLEPNLLRSLSVLKYILLSRSKHPPNYTNFFIGNDAENQKNNILGIFQNNLEKNIEITKLFKNQDFDWFYLKNVNEDLNNPSQTSENTKFIEKHQLFDHKTGNNPSSKNWIQFSEGNPLKEDSSGKKTKKGFSIKELIDVTGVQYKKYLNLSYDLPLLKPIDYNVCNGGFDIFDKLLNIITARTDEQKLFKILFDTFGLKINGVRKTEDEVEIRTEKNDVYHPISQYGDGFIKVFKIILLVFKTKQTKILIDEIDVGVHFSRLKSFWLTIFALAKETNTQLFCTTHSQDCIKAFVEAAEEVSEMKDKMRLIELEEFTKDDKLKHTATTYEFDALKYKLEVGTNVRGGDLWQ